MEKVARAMYGAREVTWTREAGRALAQIEKLGFGALPLCIAKTQKSLSDDPQVVGRPDDFEITVRDVILAAGAGYVVPLLGDIMRMPGLPVSPRPNALISPTAGRAGAQRPGVDGRLRLTRRLDLR